MKDLSHLPGLFLFIIALFFSSCSPKQTYYLKKMPNSSNYAVKGVNDTTMTMSPNLKVEASAGEIIEETTDAEMYTDRPTYEEPVKSEEGILKLVEKGDRNAQMTEREELIMELLYNRYNEMAQKNQ